MDLKKLILFVLGGFVIYEVVGYSKAPGRVKLTSVSFSNANQIILELTNFSTVTIPFNGFSGQILAENNTIVAQVNSQNQTTLINANSTFTLPIKVNYDWFAIAGLFATDISNLFSGDSTLSDELKAALLQLKPKLTGTIFLNNLDSPVDINF